MKTFVINLDKNTKRMAFMAEQLNRLGIEFERIEAVYGKELSAEEKRLAVNRFRWWCARGTMPRDGEIGCALSHIAAYRDFIASGEDCCCVLEDDCTLKDGFKEQLLRVEGWLELEKPQVVLLTNYTKERDDGTWRIVPSRGDSSSEAYVITKAAARNIVERCYPVCMPSDSWRFWVSRGWIELYHAFPTMVPSTWQLPGYASDVCPQGEEILRVSKMGWMKKCVWKVGRIVGKLLSSILI